MMRENGFPVKADPDIRSRIAELQFLEKSIGKTGLMAIRPFLDISRKELWQLGVLRQ